MGDIRIFLLHGHTRHVSYGIDDAVVRAAELAADAVVFGHTHVPFYKIIPAGNSDYGITLKKALQVFNPGSLRDTGSFGLLTVRSGKMLFSHGQV